MILVIQHCSFKIIMNSSIYSDHDLAGCFGKTRGSIFCLLLTATDRGNQVCTAKQHMFDHVTQRGVSSKTAVTHSIIRVTMLHAGIEKH